MNILLYFLRQLFVKDLDRASYLEKVKHSHVQVTFNTTAIMFH